MPPTDMVAFQGLGQRDWASLYEYEPAIQKAIHWGQEILNANNICVEEKPLDLVKACSKGGLELQEHSQTCWQQPCIFLASMAYWKRWLKEYGGLNNIVLLGFSFGEWTAATAAGCMDEETGLLAVTMRGILTSKARGSSLLVSARHGRLPVKRIRYRCKRMGEVWLANLNSPSQGLISGKEAEVLRIAEVLQEHYPRLVIRPFSIGGPFHTPLMKRARKGLKEWLNQQGVRFQEPKFPLLLNATREITREPQRIQHMLLRQLTCRLNFKKLAEELDRGSHIHEIRLGRSTVSPLVQQTWSFVDGKRAAKLLALPFPA